MLCKPQDKNSVGIREPAISEQLLVGASLLKVKATHFNLWFERVHRSAHAFYLKTGTL